MYSVSQSVAPVVDEKSNLPYNIDILWAIGDSVPDYVSTRFLLGSCSKIGPQMSGPHPIAIIYPVD